MRSRFLFALLLCAAPSVSAQRPTTVPGPRVRTGIPATSPGPVFKASQGPAGTGHRLTYDELLSLGTCHVGAGPNAGTLVRVANVGGGAMALRAPVLGGTDANDFWVDIERSALPMVVADVPLVDSPFHQIDGAGGLGLALDIDAAK